MNEPKRGEPINPFGSPAGGLNDNPQGPLDFDPGTGLGRAETTEGKHIYDIPTKDIPPRDPLGIPKPGHEAPLRPQVIRPPVLEPTYTILGMPWYNWLIIMGAAWFIYSTWIAKGDDKK